MNKTEVISNVTFFGLNYNKVYYLNKIGFYENYELIKKSNIIHSVQFWKDNYILLDDLNKPLYCSEYKSFRNIIEIDNIRISKIIDSYLIAYLKIPSFKCFLFNLETQDIYITEKNFFEYFFNDLFYSTFGNNIQCQSNNILIWHYNLPETYDWQRRVASIEKPYEATKAEIEKILGVFEGIVYFVLNSGRVVGLDVDTGIELFTKVEPDSITIAYEKERIYTPTILWQNTQLDAEKGVIFGLLGNFYAEIDLKDPSRTYRVFDMDYSNNTKRIKCTNWGVCIGEEIFFAETNFAREPATVGIFNRKTKQVTWTSDMLGEEGDFRGLKKLDYANEHLYVLDNENTLHIFNRN